MAEWVPVNPQEGCFGLPEERMEQRAWQEGADAMARAIVSEVEAWFSGVGLNVPEAGRGVYTCIEDRDWQRIKRDLGVK